PSNQRLCCLCKTVVGSNPDPISHCQEHVLREVGLIEHREDKAVLRLCKVCSGVFGAIYRMKAFAIWWVAALTIQARRIWQPLQEMRAEPAIKKLFSIDTSVLGPAFHATRHGSAHWLLDRTTLYCHWLCQSCSPCDAVFHVLCLRGILNHAEAYQRLRLSFQDLTGEAFALKSFLKYYDEVLALADAAAQAALDFCTGYGARVLPFNRWKANQDCASKDSKGAHEGHPVASQNCKEDFPS
ncbi:unnamed protein product, partial [Durusdinium trenchii]